MGDITSKSMADRGLKNRTQTIHPEDMGTQNVREDFWEKVAGESNLMETCRISTF